MQNIKLTIAYDGRNFSGWQIQRKGPRTVQGEIKRALEKILKHPIILIGAGRTDRGVHADGQVANFHTHRSHTPGILWKALNANLPDDIAILRVQRVPSSFHAQFSATSKIYRYTFLNREARCPFQRGFYMHVRYPLNLTKLRQAARQLVGRHDFQSFAGQAKTSKHRTSEKNTIRTIRRIQFSRTRDHYVICTIEADGFLYKMVRNIIGTLLDIHAGRLLAQDLPAILQARDRRQAGTTAPGCGLCLFKVKY